MSKLTIAFVFRSHGFKARPLGQNIKNLKMLCKNARKHIVPYIIKLVMKNAFFGIIIKENIKLMTSK